MEVDHFIDKVSGCGWFQFILALIVNLIETGFTFAVAFMSFGSYNPGWTCEQDNATETYKANASTNVTPRNHTALFREPNQSSLQGTCDVISSCAQVNFDPDASTVVTEWALICNRNWITSIILSIQMCGMAVGSLCQGTLADRFGRKIAFYVGNGLLLVSSLSAAFTNSWQVFSVTRFFIGLSCGFLACSKEVHLIEFTPSKWRVLMIAFPSYNLSSGLYALVLFLLRDWRQVHIVVAILSVLNLALAVWIPESLRWLAVHRKEQKIDAVVKKVTKYNRRSIPEETKLQFTSSEGTDTEKRGNVIVLFKPPVLRRTILISTALLLVAILYYAIAYGIKNLYGNFYLNFFIFSVITIPFAPLTPILGKFTGRRKGIWTLLIASSVLSFLIVLIFFVTSGEVRGLTITVLAMIISVGLDQAWCFMAAYAGELFPTSLRASGTAIVKCATRIGGIIAPFIIPRDFSVLYVCYIIAGVLCVVSCVLLVGLPETKGMPMADTVQQIAAESKVHVEKGVAIQEKDKDDADETLLENEVSKHAVM